MGIREARKRRSARGRVAFTARATASTLCSSLLLAACGEESSNTLYPVPERGAATSAQAVPSTSGSGGSGEFAAVGSGIEPTVAGATVTGPTSGWSAPDSREETAPAAATSGSERPSIAAATPTPPRALAPARIDVDESTGVARVEVRLIGERGGDASVAFETRDATAVAPDDYATRSGRLEWSATGPANRAIAVPIREDGLDEGDETLMLDFFDARGLDVERETVEIVLRDSRTPGASAADVDRWLGNTVAAPQLIANGPIKERDVSFRFRALESGCVVRFVTWWRYNSPGHEGGGYSGGNGGRYRIEFRPDVDGSPADEVLDGTEFVPDIASHPNDRPDNAFREITFNATACLEAGSMYHVVFVNTAASPREDFISFNGPYLRDVGQNVAEGLSCPDCDAHAVLRREPDDSWVLFPDRAQPRLYYTPIWCAALDNGRAVGQPMQYGHMATDMSRVSGDARTRQTIVARRGLAGPLELSFYARKRRGEAPLTVLVNGNRSTDVVMRASDTSLAEQDARVFDWHSVAVPDDLVAGQPFVVEFSAPESAEYEIASTVRGRPRCGGIGGYEGRAEISVDGGATWSGLTVFDKPDNDNGQLSLYLRSRR